MGSIFISYRRSDSEGYAGRLWDRITTKFGSENVFMDVDSINPGDNFPEMLDQALESSDVLLAIIGRDWVGLSADRTRRIDDEADFVRLEVAGAIRHGITVIPVLVGGAALPSPAELPADLAALSRFNAIEIRHSRFNDDAQRLLEGLDRALQQARSSRPAAPARPSSPILTPIFGITPGQSARRDVSALIERGRLQAFGPLKQQGPQQWTFQFAEVTVAHRGSEYTVNPNDIIYSIEYWGDEPLPLGFTTTMTLDQARQLATQHFVWLGTQDFRGLVFSNREDGPILLEISWKSGRQNPLTYEIYGPL